MGVWSALFAEHFILLEAVENRYGGDGLWSAGDLCSQEIPARALFLSARRRPAVSVLASRSGVVSPKAPGARRQGVHRGATDKAEVPAPPWGSLSKPAAKRNGGVSDVLRRA